MTENRDKIKTCPFCGATLEEKNIELYGRIVTYCYIHPTANCILSLFSFHPREIHLWNRRTEK